uniref:Putative transporter component YeeE/YedE family n=1 Tax=uncultured bacterium UPO76 TaxID=1776993 RepID=A0A140E008_9BACT|nr:putative transporter component YeeE/YedE family [uncultured bacterium UPO76]
MRGIGALGFGAIFGAGLALSGMTNPAKVLAFLDVFGAWDPTLAVVMASALAVSAAGYVLAQRRDRTWLGEALLIPTRRDIDGSLVGGAALFGVGWGLVGLCPGPALASLSRGSFEVGLFVAAMLAGVVGYRVVTRQPAPALSGATPLRGE